MTESLPPAIRAEYPFPSQWFDRGDGIRLHYLDEGEGPPVVMVHGNPSWSFHFRDLVRGLSDRFRCVVPDHVGMGLSDKPGDDRYHYTLASRVDDLERLLDRLGIVEGATLVLQDWGGMIGLGWALRARGRVARLVVLNTSGFLLPASRSFHWQLALARSVLMRPIMLGLGGFSQTAVRTCVRRPGSMTAARREAYLWPHRSWSDRRAVLRFVEDIPLAPGDPAWDTARAIDEGLGTLAGLPVFIAWGSRDFVFDGHFLAEWRCRFPQAEVLELPDCGHWVLEDAPEQIVPRVRAFLGAG